MIPSQQQAYFMSTDVVMKGNNGFWLSSDGTQGVGLKPPQIANDIYQLVLPADLPLTPNNQFLGIQSIVGSDAFTEWSTAAGKIPWSVAQPGTAYETISEFTSLSTALTTAQSTNSHISVLVLPGEHDAQPNVVLPANVDLIGWGQNVSVINGEVLITGPYGTVPNIQYWYIRELDLRNTGKGNVALRMTNNGTPINNGGVLYCDNCSLNGNITVSNDDGGAMSFQVCKFDSSEVCFTGTNGGSINLFDCVVLTASGGIVSDMDGQRMIVNWSGIFNGFGNTTMTIRNEQLRFDSCFVNIDEIDVIDADLESNNTRFANGTLIKLQTITTGGSAALRSTIMGTLEPNASFQTKLDNCYANSIQSSTATGFDLLINNSTFDHIFLIADPLLSTNRIKMYDSQVSDYMIVNGQIDSPSEISGSKLLNNVSILIDQISGLNLTQNYLNFFNVESSSTNFGLQFFQNYVQGSGPLFRLIMSPDAPLFIQNTFNLSGNLAIADTNGITISTQNNISTPTSYWNTATLFPAWETL